MGDFRTSLRRSAVTCASALFPGLLALSGCGPPSEEGILVHCGGGLRLPVAELVERFEREHGIHVAVNYDGSERLIGTIEVSRRGDVVVPGDRHYIDLLAGKDLVGKQASICYFVPTILVSRRSDHVIRTLEDLLKPGVRLGLGDERACAIGRVSRKVFEKNGISWGRVIDHVSFNAGKVDELGQHVEVGSLDAVIVWDATAHQFADGGKSVPIAVEQNVISTVDAGVLTFAPHPEWASELVDFLASLEAKAVFRKHGFRVDAPE